MRSPPLSLLVLLGIAASAAGSTACEAPAGRAVRARASGITNGTPTGYERWQGVVALDVGGALCTGTFVDPQVVLTAAHCVYLPAYGVDVLSNPGAVSVLGGADLGDGRITYARGVARTVIHPTWTGEVDEFATGALVDLALLFLRSAPPGAPEPFPVRSAPPSVGESGWVVGYGQTSYSGSGSLGVHREGETTILSIFNPSYLELGDPSGTCEGDSGGPLLTDEGQGWEVTAVSSVGSPGACDPASGSYSANAVTHREWIAGEVLSATGRDLADGTTGDGGADGDADGDAESGRDVGVDDGSASDGDTAHPPAGGGRFSSCAVVAPDTRAPGALLRALASAVRAP